MVGNRAFQNYLRGEKTLEVTSSADASSLQDIARQLVYGYVKSESGTPVTFTGDDVLLVWFCKTLQNWKALVITTLPDNMYYEVTYNGDKKETYLDAYSKVENVCFPDEEVQPMTNEHREQKGLLGAEAFGRRTSGLFRRKPTETAAIQFTGDNFYEILNFFGDIGSQGIKGPTQENPDHLILTTAHGDPAPCRAGDWVLPDSEPNTFYPCKQDVFSATYEPVMTEPIDT